MSLITHKPKPRNLALTLAYEPDAVTVRLYNRWYALRKRGKEIGEELVPPILQEGPAMYTFSNPYDPWGSRERLSVEELERLVTLAEVRVAVTEVRRKEMTSAETSLNIQTVQAQKKEA